MLLAINPLGMGLEPLRVGMLSDGISAFGDDSVRYTLSIGASLSVVVGIAYLSGSDKYARAIAQSEEGPYT